MSSDAPSMPIVKPIAEVFTNCTALWATTFNLDLGLFNEYLLRRLGEPPLNAVVLADRERLDATLDAIPPERVDALEPVNRRWLLRGARVGTGRFHSKSYLTVTQRTVKLLVGSGNLNSGGLDAGREVFAVFWGGTPAGDAALRTWVSWMRRLVRALDDTVLASRFVDLEVRLAKVATGPTTVVESPLWHNLDRPLAEQLCDAVGSTELVDEIIVTAPFYDETGEALNRLIDRLRPKRLTLYMASATSVDGNRLAERLSAASAEVETFRYVPDRFTHAKIIGIVAGRHGWLLSGSANLSNAALWLTSGRGNVELAVFARVEPAEVLATFLPPGVTAEAWPLTSLAELTFVEGAEATDTYPVRLSRATLLPDARIRIVTEPATDPGWRLADHWSSLPLSQDAGGATTTAPLAGQLVRVVAADGRTISNAVVVDDPEALSRALEPAPASGAGRPPELAPTDLDTPLGQALLYLHRNVVMDVSEQLGAGTGGAEATSTEAAGNESADDDLWDRLEREKLGRDPRVSTYSRLYSRSPSMGGVGSEPLIELLDAMGERSPSADGPHSGGSFLRELVPAAGAGSQWAAVSRIRVRARNVLRRWATAQTDPRLAWVDPLAPLGNLGLVAAVFCVLWRRNAEPDALVELPDSDLDDLWARWFHPFVGTGQGDGWLDRADLGDTRVRSHLDGDLAHNATALCWLAIRPGADRRGRIVAWQPYLRSAFDKGMIDVDPNVADYLSAVTRGRLDTDQVIDDLLEALDFIDDELWCAQTAELLGFTDMRLEVTERGQDVALRVRVSGIEHPLYDSRIPTLIGAVRRYRSAEAVAIFGSDSSWRLAVAPDDEVVYLPSVEAGEVQSEPRGAGSVAALAVGQGVLADLFPPEARVA